MEELIEFLKEYEALCKKYKVEIGSCGCCHSPFLSEKYEEVEVEDLIYDIKKQKLYFSIRYGNPKYYYNKHKRTDLDIETLEEIKDEVRWKEEN